MAQPQPRPRLRVVRDDEDTPAEITRNAVWRPSSLGEMVGQARPQMRIKMLVSSALKRGRQPGHVLISGPYGLGKTTLSAIIAGMINEGRPDDEKVGFHSTTGDGVSSPQQMAATLCKLQEGDVLFIDEGHQMGLRAEEMIGLAMEDGRITVPGTKSGSVPAQSRDIPAFTLVIGTTKPANISAPLRSRFALSVAMEYYSIEELAQIVTMKAEREQMAITQEAAEMIAGAGRHTPRLTLGVFDLVSAYVDTIDAPKMDAEVTAEAFTELGIDSLGLDDRDRDYLEVVASYAGRRVGLAPLSATSGLDSREISHDIEPYLMRVGLIDLTSRGRCLSKRAYAHLYPDQPIPPMLGLS